MTDGDATAAAAAQAARTLDEQAREHKRLAAYHRRQAQTIRQRLDALARAGIHLDPTQPKGGHSHG